VARMIPSRPLRIGNLPCDLMRFGRRSRYTSGARLPGGLVPFGVSPQPVADSRGDRPVAPALVSNASRTGEELMPAGTRSELQLAFPVLMC
jgi:hypothetical protein